MYKVLAATRADMNEGWVWLSDHDFAPRSIIKVKNKSNKKSVYCEYLEIDNNFIKEYDQPPRVNINTGEKTIVINGWYRNGLGDIITKTHHDLQITPANSWWGKFRASEGHPQAVIRLATRLAAISVGLGAISIVLTLN